MLKGKNQWCDKNKQCHKMNSNSCDYHTNINENGTNNNTITETATTKTAVEKAATAMTLMKIETIILVQNRFLYIKSLLQSVRI